MSMFDSIIDDNGEKFGLGDKAGSLLSSLLGLITDQSQGGFAGFLDRFRQAGLSDRADSWVSTGANSSLSNKQVESVLGTETINEMARQAGVDEETTKTALGKMIPSVVDSLTPAGVVPTEDDLLSKIGGYLSGVGGSTVSTTGVMAGDTIDRIGTAAAEDINRQNTGDLMDGEFNDDSPAKWLVPLIILVLLIVLGWAFCSKPEAPHAAVTNTNVKPAMTNIYPADC
jgi:uncharacterized protein YidB (DUF937 family)